jgi:alpha-glucosidase
LVCWTPEFLLLSVLLLVIYPSNSTDSDIFLHHFIRFDVAFSEVLYQLRAKLLAGLVEREMAFYRFYKFTMGSPCPEEDDLIPLLDWYTEHFLSSPIFWGIWFLSFAVAVLHTLHHTLGGAPSHYSLTMKLCKASLLANAAITTLFSTVYAQSYSVTTNSAVETTTSFRALFTVPAAADNSVPLIPNINDPEAVNPQDVCPGYTATNVVRTAYGLTADLALAGAACNLYGTDVDALRLTVEYQSSDRLHVAITPAYIDATNSSWFVLPEALVQKPTIDADANSTTLDNDLNFVWSNDPTFSFSVIRQSTGDTLFSTTGTQLVFENQFIEFATVLPDNYNLYGLGEVIHGLRMGNNFTRTFWAADSGDPIDFNIYGDHSFYLDTRYFEVNKTTGGMTYAPNGTDATADYVSYSHGVYLRNSHGQEVLMRPSNLTWRTLGGEIDLYFYAGPTQKEVTQSYQLSATGLPAMQQYFAFGYHQSRWGYANWSDLQDVVDNFARFSIPLENIW